MSDQKILKNTEKDDTRYYDEVFQRLKNSISNNDGDLEGENESGKLKVNKTYFHRLIIEFCSDVIYENVIDELKTNEEEIKKCFKSYHVDYFIYKSKPNHFSEIFSILTKNKENFEDYMTHPKISRAFEACLLTIGEKIQNKNADEEENEVYLRGLKNIGEFLVDNYEKVFENNIAIYILRTFIRIIGVTDPFESLSNKDKSLTNKKSFRTKNDNSFSMKDIKPKLIPDEWKTHSYLKKFARCTASFSNILGNFFFNLIKFHYYLIIV